MAVARGSSAGKGLRALLQSHQRQGSISWPSLALRKAGLLGLRRVPTANKTHTHAHTPLPWLRQEKTCNGRWSYTLASAAERKEQQTDKCRKNFQQYAHQPPLPISSTNTSMGTFRPSGVARETAARWRATGSSAARLPPLRPGGSPKL